jgi:hypothetical protein
MTTTTVYAVVEVWRGMVADVNAFHDYGDAEKYYREIEAQQNELENDVKLLTVEIQ